MTDEQIKLNAEVYANTLLVGGLGDSPKLIARVSFEEGAHSRDKEIEQLEFDKYLHTKRIKVQEEIIAELRNPWISVEDRLPEENKNNNGYSIEVIGLFKNGSISNCFCSIEENIWFIGGFVCDKPIAWMKIPK